MDKIQTQTSLSTKELCPDDLLAGQEAAFARDIERIHKRSSEFVKVNCPACGQNNSQWVFKKYGFNFESCNNCKTIYMTPRPSKEVMQDYYANSENYAYWAKYIFPASEESRKNKIHKPWLDRIINYCKTYNINKEYLLEVGPGFGTFSSLALESYEFENVIAIEPTPEMAASCRDKGITVINKKIEDINDELPLVDIIVSFEVIEHLFHPKSFLDKVFPLLKPGGLLVLSCPNGLGFDIRILKEKSQAVDAEHVNLFNPSSLSLLVENCGFEVMTVHTPGRLDAEIVRESAINGHVELEPFLNYLLIECWDEHGEAFQTFLAEQNLSSHMWLAARKPNL